MKTYAVYLESGPRKRTTMVHVLDVLGCSSRGPTTEHALAGTPATISAYLRFLKRHGEPCDPSEESSIDIAEHITEGYFLGQGSPTVIFQPELEPLTDTEAAKYIQRLEWQHADLLALLGTLPESQLDARPLESGRTVQEIIEHIIGAEQSYVWSIFGPVAALNKIFTALQKGTGDPLELLPQARKVTLDRLRSMTADECSRQIAHGQQIWTARKAIRRLLEHEWEHYTELSERVSNTQTEPGTEAIEQ